MRAKEFTRARSHFLPVCPYLNAWYLAVDDNTGIIECHHKDLVTPLSPSKRKDKAFQGFNYPPLPPPVTYVGRSVTITGRVCRGRKIFLTVGSIGQYRPNSCLWILVLTVFSVMQNL